MIEGANEILPEDHQHNHVNNHQENNNDAKKVKLNNGDQTENGGGGGNSPSRVVHIRNIPSDVSETEIVHLGIPFGRVSNVLVLKVSANWASLHDASF